MSPKFRRRPRPTILVAFSGIVVTEISSGVVDIEWNVTPDSQGQVYYDTSSRSSLDQYAGQTAQELGYLPFHRQRVSNLTPGATIYFRIWGRSAAGNSAFTSEATFTAPGDITDPGITYTDVAWPTGTGWTAGPVATARANIESLISSSGSGASATDRIRHRIPAGTTYTTDRRIVLPYLLEYVDFDHMGTPRGGTLQGSTGGARVHVATTPVGGSHEQSVWSTSPGAPTDNTRRARDIKWYNGTASGIVSTATNYQMGFELFGLDGFEITGFNVQDVGGYGIVLWDSSFGWGSTLPAFPTKNGLVRGCNFLHCRTQSWAAIMAQDIITEDCYFYDTAGVDIEPDRYWEINARMTFRRLHWGPSPWNVSPIGLTRPDVIDTNQTWTYEGNLDILDCIFEGPLARLGPTNYGSGDIHLGLSNQLNILGPVTITGNRRLNNRHIGPAVQVRNAKSSITIRDNGLGGDAFLTSGAFFNNIGGNTGTLNVGNNF